MVDKSSLRKMKQRLVSDILSIMHNANDVYFDAEDKDDKDYAASTINICRNLLNSMVF